MGALPRTYSIAELAEAIGQSERYVREKARLREWPHVRFARGEVRFTPEDVDAVLELCRVDVATASLPRLSLAPRSRRRRTA